MLRWTFALCVLVTVSADVAPVSRVIQLDQGPVRGYKDDNVYAYYGIPYATAPTGPNRYKAPLPPPTNQVPLEAVEKGIICPQVEFTQFTTNKIVQEDCLIANIFVPDTDDDKLPVMVQVHGGAFQIGYGNWLLPKNLIRTKNMIVVTFNYRLSLNGFLCLGTEDVPGNAGMKDQIALLRWVKSNIAAFGGNPNDVTIDGGSAGGASVDLLMLSRAAKGLFNKAIPESGSSLAAFSMQSDPLENAKIFARQLNFTKTDDIYALEEFYKTTPWEQLIIDAFIVRTDSTFMFSPCIERNLGQEVFLDEDPLSILKQGNYEKVPLLIGFASMEGLFRIEQFDTWKNKMNENFSEFLPADLTFDNEAQKQEVANEIKQFYFGDKPISTENILSYVDFYSDVIFTVPALRSVELHLKNGHNKVYLYVYSFTDEDIPLVPHTNVRGANHCAQTMAVMDGNNLFVPDESNASVEYKKIKSVIRQMWSNFITTGEPVPKGSALPSWPAVGANWTPYMSLDQTVELKDALLAKTVRFWTKIYDKYYRTPIPPPEPPKRKTEL